MNSKTMPGEHQIIVIGLDAGDPHLIKLWSKTGKLPFLSSLIKSGTWASLASRGDFSSDSVWPSFSTGVSPAKHGIYFIRQLKRGTDRIARMDSEHGHYLPFWWHLRKSGKKVAIFDVPRMNPINGINGIQISSWGNHYPTLNGARSIPSEIINELVSRFGKYHVTDEVINTKGLTQERKLLARILEAVQKKSEAAKFVMKQDKWDLFISVFQETQSAGHQFYHHTQKSHWAHDEQFVKEMETEPLFEIYSALDSALSELLGNISKNVTYFVVSCHGMTPNYTADQLMPEIMTKLGFQIAAASVKDNISEQKDYFSTHKAGLLARVRSLFPGPARDMINRILPLSIQEYLVSRLFAGSIDWRKTAAFTLPSDGGGVSYISLNLKGREPYGMIEPGQGYDRMCKEIKEELIQLSNPSTGKAAVQEVVITREVFQGNFIHHLPDLAVRWSQNYPIKSLYHPRFGTVTGDSSKVRKSAHSGEGFLIGGGKYIEKSKTIDKADVVDIAPTLLYLMGQPVPKDMDGRVLLEIISDEFKKENPVKYEKVEMIAPE